MSIVSVHVKKKKTIPGIIEIKKLIPNRLKQAWTSSVLVRRDRILPMPFLVIFLNPILMKKSSFTYLLTNKQNFG